MELRRINYASAVFFGVAAIVLYFLTGLLQLILISRVPEYAAAIGNVSAWQVLGLVPLIGGAVTYLIVSLAICIYNSVAKRYPISWVVKK